MARDPWSVDLHSHTLYSDGTLTPTELVRLARMNGVRALAVSDHDHTGGLDEALQAGSKVGLEIIPGIELSVSHAEFEDIHLLAYYFAWHDPHLQARLEDFRIARETRAERILERINAKLSTEGREPIAYTTVKTQVQGAFGRPHIAAALLDHGYVRDMNAAFKDYLIPCNVPKYYMPADEALALVHQARGLSSVAHPRFITPDRVRLQQVIQELRASGLDAIEAYHSDHYPEDRSYLIRLANQSGMIVTGGSDYHGFKGQNGQPDSGGKLGSLQLPYGVAVRLRRTYFRSYPMILLLLQWPPAAAAAIRRGFASHYQLTSGNGLQAATGKSDRTQAISTSGSMVVDLATVNDSQVEALLDDGKAYGRRIVGVPWATAKIEKRDGLYLTGGISTERYRRTSVERLAHEIAHDAILTQLDENLSGRTPSL
jgi:3',5'-nucleoside bisphosphate phosphatase